MNETRIGVVSAEPLPPAITELMKESADMVTDLMHRAVARGDAPENFAIIILEHEEDLEGRTVQLSDLRRIHENPTPLNGPNDQMWSTATKFLIEREPVPGACLVLFVCENTQWGVAYFFPKAGTLTNSPGGTA